MNILGIAYAMGAPAGGAAATGGPSALMRLMRLRLAMLSKRLQVFMVKLLVSRIKSLRLKLQPA